MCRGSGGGGGGGGIVDLEFRLRITSSLGALNRAASHQRAALQQKAVEALIRAQARLDHARNGAAAKQSARDVAAERQGDVGEQLQVRVLCCMLRAAGYVLHWELSLGWPRGDCVCQHPVFYCSSSYYISAVCPPLFPTSLPLPPALFRQVAKYFAEYFAGVWERKESEAAEAAQALHRSEVWQMRCCAAAAASVGLHAVVTKARGSLCSPLWPHYSI